MATDYRVKVKIILRPIKQPWIKIVVNNQTQVYQLDQQTEFEYDFRTTNSTEVILIEHYNKDVNDSETAVEIVGLDFFGITDPKFAWAGVYCPDYPEPWYSQQLLKPEKSLPAQTYIGWNGIYQLKFSVPVFEWMHGVLNLGWIYR